MKRSSLTKKDWRSINNKLNIALKIWIVLFFLFILIYALCYGIINLQNFQEKPIIQKLQIDYLEIREGNNTFILQNFSVDYDKVALNKLLIELSNDKTK